MAKLLNPSSTGSHELPSTLVKRLSGTLAGGGPTVTTHRPVDGAPIATMRTATSEDVASAFARARVAQLAWAETPVKERAKPFVRYHDLIINNSQLIDLIQVENGKSRNGAFEETLDIAGLSLYYARNAEKFLKSRRRKGAIPVATKAFEHRQAKGVVAIIAPWNYPLSLSVCDAIPALLAGNAIVVKADTQTALTAAYARELLIEAGVPADLFELLIGEPEEIGDALLDHAQHVTFTGSTAAGRRIGEAAARRLIGCTLELGGKNPMLVLDDADLDKTARGAMRACFSTTGQLCLSVERIYVDEKVYDEFVPMLAAHTKKLRLGSGPGHDYDIGTMSLQRQFDTVVRHVEDARSKGAQVLAGGKARPDLGPHFYEPTVLTGVTPDMELFRNETFGPVVAIYPVASDDEAVRLANATEYGLNASIWTRDTARGHRLGQRIQAGTVNINEGVGSAYASNDAPMGGMKASGQGRRHGEHGLLEYTELQTVASQHVIGFDPMPGVSTKQNARLLTGMLKAMKALRIK
ncbi:succinic semialdehyde dehydrogenase [Nocardioides speluncae]|uniref:succinic semialdehyde dehydrogenase n=1 Tax=Nocardioides speluncae TaxID=2670337 RepID=UPI000D699CF3|nr:succinic semialdehyde dehydrogenase [Nocardioides speluncae]